MSGWPNYPGPMNYGQNEPKEASFNEEQPIIDYLETRYDNDPHYNDPTDPDQYQQYDYFDQFSIQEDDDGCELETYYDDAGDGTETEII